MKIFETLRKKHISEFILIIFLLCCSSVILKYTENINFPSIPYYSRLSDFIELLKIEIVPENSNTLLTSVYRRYIILFLGGGYLTYLILLTILFHKTCKDSILYMGPLYFSLAMGAEILSYILPFDMAKIFFTSLSWIFAFCGYIRFIKYFWDTLFNKTSKFIEWLIFLLIVITVFPLALAIKEFHYIYFNENLVSSAFGIHLFFNYFKSGFLCIILIFSFASLIYNRKNKNVRTEAGYYFVLFAIQFLLNTYIYNNLSLYGNFEFMAHIMLNILFVHVQLEEIKLKTENQFFRSITFNAIRILITFITISYFAKQTTPTGYVTLLLAMILSVEIVSFVVMFFTEEVEVGYDNFLNRLKGIESLEEFKNFTETELTKMFRLIECNVVLIPLNTSTKLSEEKPLIEYSPIFFGKKYDICFKIQNRNKPVGFIYVKDPWLLLYRKKFKNFKALTNQIAPLVENLALKTIQINHYKKREKYLVDRIEKLEKDIFYIKELAGLIEKVDDKKKLHIMEMIKIKLNQNSGGEE